MTAKLEVAQLYASLKLQGMAEAQSGLNRVKSGLLNVKTAIAGIATAVGIKKIAGSFLDSAVSVENYQTSLNAVIKDAKKSKQVFKDLNDWAAINPIDTTDAIDAFVRFKTAAVDNTMEAVKASADLATVMQTSVSEVANAIVTTETESLRRFGILLDKSGKQAIIQSGEVRIAVNNDVESIRRGLVELMQKQFGGAMKSAENNWRGMMATMSGMWTKFRQDVMGSTDSGGPFSKLERKIRDVRDRWANWTQSTDYDRFISDVQDSAIEAINSLSDLGEKVASLFAIAAKNVDKVVSGLKALVTMRISGTLLAIMGVSNPVSLGIAATGAALVYMNDQFPVAEDKTSSLSSAMEILQKRSNALKNELDSLSVWGNDFSAQRVRKELEEVEKQLESLRESAALIRSDELEVLRHSGSKILGVPSPPSPTSPNKDNKTSSSLGSSESAASRLVSSMRDQMKYLNIDGETFLGTLDKWMAKLKPLSDDWKKIADVRMEILGDKAKKATDDTVAVMNRLNESKRMMAEAKAAAQEGVERFWQDMSWENGQGLLGDGDYFAMLKKELESLTQGSDAWKARFSEIQTLAGEMASSQLTALNQQLQNGLITQQQWKTAVEELKTKYGELPKVVNDLNQAQEDTKNTASGVADMTKLWANDLARGLADAIVNAKDLGDALRNVAKSIASGGLQKLIGGWLGFADGGVFSHGKVIPFARGGVVTVPTLFPMARGMGLMGEAGPEAVMPLKRGADGKLGVAASGGMGGNTTINNFHISAVDAKSFADLVSRNPGAIVAAVGGNYHNNGAMRRVIKGS